MHSKINSIFAFSYPTFHRIAWVALTTLPLITATANAGDLTEAQIASQWRTKLAAPAETNAPDPYAAFGGDEGASKSLRTELKKTRLPDTNGACLGDEGNADHARKLAVIPMAPAGSPQVILPLQFSSGKYLLSKTDEQQLEKVAKVMNDSEFRAARFTIAGHADAKGDDLINRKISCERALSVRTYLIEHGVAAERLSAYGFGSSRPINANVRDASENRRVEFRRADI